MKALFIADLFVLGTTLGITFTLWKLLRALEVLNAASRREAEYLEALWRKITSEIDSELRRIKSAMDVE